MVHATQELAVAKNNGDEILAKLSRILKNKGTDILSSTVWLPFLRPTDDGIEK
jgi:hypothetical protein